MDEIGACERLHDCHGHHGHKNDGENDCRDHCSQDLFRELKDVQTRSDKHLLAI
jgi:hypothetical protein